MRVTRVDRVVFAIAACWTVAVLALTFFMKGDDADNVTRVAVLVVLAVDVARAWATRRRAVETASTSTFSARAIAARWVLPCTARALIVELCYMPSKPLYDSLRWLDDDDVAARATKAAIDVALTAPFYVLVFAVLWRFVGRRQAPLWHLVLVLPFSQAIGDGNALFLANPAMLLLSPYVVLNYVACQLVPLWRLRPALPTTPRARMLDLLLPLVVVPAVYWCGGAVLIAVGRALGLRD